jgi:hypothetical protein
VQGAAGSPINNQHASQIVKTMLNYQNNEPSKYDVYSGTIKISAKLIHMEPEYGTISIIHNNEP